MSGTESIWKYIDRRIDILRHEGRNSTAKNYWSTKKCLLRFLESMSVDKSKIDAMTFREIDEVFVKRFQDYLRQNDIIPSTVSFYNRTLRSIYNQAAKDSLVKNTHPFDNVYTGVEKKFTPVPSTVRTPSGEVITFDKLSKPELVKRYKSLQDRYNSLVNQLSSIVGA